MKISREMDNIKTLIEEINHNYLQKNDLYMKFNSENLSITITNYINQSKIIDYIPFTTNKLLMNLITNKLYRNEKTRNLFIKNLLVRNQLKYLDDYELHRSHYAYDITLLRQHKKDNLEIYSKIKIYLNDYQNENEVSIDIYQNYKINLDNNIKTVFTSKSNNLEHNIYITDDYYKNIIKLSNTSNITEEYRIELDNINILDINEQIKNIDTIQNNSKLLKLFQ